MNAPHRHSRDGGNPEQLITQHLETWTNALKPKASAGRGSNGKTELYGIKKLRELILELAVRGLLVPQDPNDEPASVLLEKIAIEKAQLVKEGKIKKQKALSPIGEGEKPFELPNGWECTLLDTISNITGGFAFKSSNYQDDGVRVVRISDFDEKGFKSDKIVRHAFSSTLEQFSLEVGNILMAMTGGTVGKSLLVESMSEPMVVNQRVATIKLKPAILSSYIHCILQTSGVQAVIQDAKNSTNDNISMSDIKSFKIPLPPLAEQHRIVDKVDELMALCDLLELQTEASLKAHQTLVETLLNALTQAPNAQAFNAAWQRIAEHFDTLFITEHSIDQLKQCILQLAVMGKLVPQDPNDEPASELLKKIAAEKAQLVKEKKIKKQKSLPPIGEDEKPFELSDGWEWSRLDDICFGITSGTTPPKSDFDENNGVPYLKVYNIRDQEIDFSYRPQFITDVCHQTKLKRSILLPGDVVMNIVGPPLGKTAIVPDSYPEWNCNQAVTFFRPIAIELNSYIYTYLKAGIFLDAIELIGTAGQDNISVTKSRSILLPTPPLEEQHRIVAKVDELMALCDQLKTRLNQAQTTQLHLADAICEQAI